MSNKQTTSEQLPTHVGGSEPVVSVSAGPLVPVRPKSYPQKLIAITSMVLNRVFRQSTQRRIARKHENVARAFGWNSATISFVAPLLAVIFWLYMFLDKPIALLVRDAPPSVIGFFGAITDYGKSAWIITGIGILVFLFTLLDWSRFAIRSKVWFASVYTDLIITFYCVAVSGILVALIKNSIGRARPKMMNLLGPHYFDPFAFKADYASFPSGHATTFGAFCMVLALRFPKLAAPILIVALLGGASRVFVGAHYPSDALAGLLFGAGFTLITARWLARRNIAYRLPSTDAKFTFIPRRKVRLRKKGTSLGLHHDFWAALKR